MATAVTRARYIQLGKESTKGTAVAATKRYPGELAFEEEVDYYEPPYPQQVRGDVSGQLVNVRNGFKGSYKSELTAEELVTFLAMCLKGGVTPTNNSGDYTWVFTPPVAADPSINAYTLEFGPNDWSTNWTRQVPYVFAPKISLSGAKNQVCEINAELVGRKVVAGATPTGSLANWSGRTPLVGNLTKVYIDSASGSLGGTQKTLSVLNWKVDMVGGIVPEDTLDGRSDLDFAGERVGDIGIDIDITALYNGNANTEFAAWRAKTLRAIRIITTGATVVAAARTVQIDATCEYVSAQTIGSQDGNDIVNLKMKGKYNSTYTKMFEVTVINGVSALA